MANKNSNSGNGTTRVVINESVRPVTTTVTTGAPDGMGQASAHPVTTGFVGGEGASVQPATTGQGGQGGNTPKPRR